jgi:hypothetical protein
MGSDLWEGGTGSDDGTSGQRRKRFAMVPAREQDIVTLLFTNVSGDWEKVCWVEESISVATQSTIECLERQEGRHSHHPTHFSPFLDLTMFQFPLLLEFLLSPQRVEK